MASTKVCLALIGLQALYPLTVALTPEPARQVLKGVLVISPLQQSKMIDKIMSPHDVS